MSSIGEIYPSSLAREGSGTRLMQELEDIAQQEKTLLSQVRTIEKEYAKTKLELDQRKQEIEEQEKKILSNESSTAVAQAQKRTSASGTILNSYLGVEIENSLDAIRKRELQIQLVNHEEKKLGHRLHYQLPRSLKEVNTKITQAQKDLRIIRERTGWSSVSFYSTSMHASVFQSQMDAITDMEALVTQLKKERKNA